MAGCIADCDLFTYFYCKPMSPSPGPRPKGIFIKMDESSSKPMCRGSIIDRTGAGFLAPIDV